MKALIQNRIEKAISDKTFPGCVVGVVRKNGKRLVVPAGNFTYEPNSTPISDESIFDVASITKSIPTSSLALQLIGEGKLNTDDKLTKFLPEFRNSDKDNVLIKHLLTQTLDFSFHLSELKDKSPDEILERIFTTDFASKPGMKYSYSNATSVLLGMVVEKILNKPLDILGEEHFFKPLKMTRTTFEPLKKFKKEEIVPTEFQKWRGGLVQGEVHDESAYALTRKVAVGSAGLFSTVPDLLNFLEMLLNNGSLNGRRYFTPEIMEEFQTNQLEDIGECNGLGWKLRPRYMGKHLSDKTFSKSGFTGCVCVCDIINEVGFVILSNYTFPTRKPDAKLINQFRSDIANIISENI